MRRTKLNLNIHPELVEQMKQQADKEMDSVSRITERLWRKYLKEKTKEE